MTYDQAQSPRLGQRTAIESTYVRSFDVDPATPTADLLEAAWPGMLIHRKDLGILQIYNGEANAWEDIGGSNTGGHLTFVGASPPTTGPFTIGDTWYDSDAGYKAYVWDGDSWEPVTGEGGIKTFRQPDPPTSLNIGDIWIDSNDGEKQYRANAVGVDTVSDGSTDGWVLIQDHGIVTAQDTANRKTRAYYANGYAPDDGDPDTPPVFVPLTTAPDGTPLTVGDVWYQIDAGNRVWFWTGTVWADATDPNTLAALNQANANYGAIGDINLALENLQLVGTSINNTADTADGRISTSDYMPGPDDLTYTQFIQQLDTSVSPPVPMTVEYQASRVNGSLWFTQTRPRRNWCTNPSFETNLTGWASSGATIARDDTEPHVPAGIWTLLVTNTGTSAHTVTWGATTPAPAQAGEAWSASIFAELITGNGAAVTLELVWVDDNGTFISSTISPPYQLMVDAFSVQPPGTTNEWRMWAHGTAPVDTAGVYVRLTSPAGANNSDTWHTGALLLEPEKDLGRYFDGDSYDGYWNGTPHGSTSQLHGDKIFQVWELRDSQWVRKYLTDDTTAPIDGSQIVGSINGEIIGDNTIVQDKHYAALVLAYENLDVGDIVHVYNDHGLFVARKANASLGSNYEAHGFVIDTTTAGTSVRVYHFGYNKYLAGLTPGAAWLSPTPGKVQNRPANGAGQLVQMVGFAPSATTLNFEPRLAIKIT